MTDDLRELYQEVILDHGKHPRNFRHPADANLEAHGYNPLCGDQLTVYVKRDDGGVIRDIAFEGRGCAISTASASLLTEALKGKTLDDAEALFESFHELVTGLQPAHDEPGLGKLAAFSGVCDYPTRVKCATLAWHALHAALEGDKPVVSTEEPGE